MTVYLELFTHKTMKVLRSTESNINKNENSKNEPHLSVKELLLVHCNILNNNYQQKS